MNLKVDKKQIPLIFGLLAVIAAILIYFFIYRSYQEKILNLESANTKLQGQFEDLTGKANSREYYQNEILNMDQGIQLVYNAFPPMVEEEDAVMEAMRLEALAPMRVEGLDFADPVSLYTVGSGQTDGSAPPPPAAEEDVMGETTVEQDVATAQAGGTTNYGELQVPDLSFSTGTLPPGYQGEFGPITLNVNTVNYNFSTSYEGLKRTLNYFISNPNRRTIQSISLGFNSDTGLLTVSAVVNEYSLTGTGKVYDYPALPSVATGTSNIFSSNSFANGELVDAFLRGSATMEDLEQANGAQEGAEGGAPAQNAGNGEGNGFAASPNTVNAAQASQAVTPADQATVVTPATPAGQ